MIITILIFLAVLSLIIFVHELGHFLAARRAGVKVEEFAFGFPPRIFAIKKGETTYAINAIPIGGYVKLYDEIGKNPDDPHSFAGKSIAARFWVIVAGVAMNFVLAIVLLSVGFMIGMPPLVSEPTAYTKEVKSNILILSVESGSPAAQLGLSYGDRILLVNNQPISSVDNFRNFTREHRGQEIELTFQHSGQTETKKITLQDKEEGALGVAIVEEAKVQLPIYRAIYAGAVETGKTIYYVILAFGRLIKDLIIHAKVSGEIAGPVGIYTLTGESVRLGFIYLLQFVVLLTINLGIINILPFPALDGGRLVFIVLEKLRGKKIAFQVENAIHLVGFALLIVLIILITYRDIIRIIMK